MSDLRREGKDFENWVYQTSFSGERRRGGEGGEGEGGNAALEWTPYRSILTAYVLPTLTLALRLLIRNSDNKHHSPT